MSRFYSRAELDASPSRLSGLDAKRETQLRWAACDLIKEAGMRLKVPQLTIATATVFCHRFYALNSHTRTENDWHVLAPACLFLAGKVEETPKALRDVVFVVYMLRHRKEPEKAQEALKNNKELVAAEGEKLLGAERKLLHTLGFEFTVAHPYMSLNNAVKKMRALAAAAAASASASAGASAAAPAASSASAATDGNPAGAAAVAAAAAPGVVGVDATRDLFQVAWNFINDSLRTTLCLQYDAKAIAAAVLYLAARFKKTKLPDVASPQGSRWWDSVFGFPVSLPVCEEIGNQILDLYQQSGKTMLADAGLQQAAGQGAAAIAAAAPSAATTATGATGTTGGAAAAAAAAAAAVPAAPAAAAAAPAASAAAAQPRREDASAERWRAGERDRERERTGGGGGGGHDRGRERDRDRERDRERGREHERSRERSRERRRRSRSRSRSRERKRSRSRDRRDSRDSPRRRSEHGGGGGGGHRHGAPPERRPSENARALAAAAAAAAAPPERRPSETTRADAALAADAAAAAAAALAGRKREREATPPAPDGAPPAAPASAAKAARTSGDNDAPAAA